VAIEIVEALAGMELGKGYSRLSGAAKLSPAVRGTTGPSPGGAGQQGGYSFTIVKGSDEFNQVLEVGASVSAGLGAFHASAKARFAENCKVSSMSTVCVLSFHAINAFESFHGDVELAPDAEELLRLGDKKRFRERFGDCFVSGRFTGGEFYGTVRIETESTERDEEVAVAINASFGPFKASGSVDKGLSEKMSREKVEILTWQSGGSVGPVSTLEEMFERAKVIARQIGDRGATPISVMLDGYEELKLPTDDISSVEEAHAREVVRRLEKDYHSLLECRQDIDYVLRHQDYFENVRVKALNDAARQIAKDLNTIVEKADACSRDFGQCAFFSPVLPDMERLIPERKRKSQKQKIKARNERAARLRRDAAKLEDLAQRLPQGTRRRRLREEANELERKAMALLAASAVQARN
jgi:hypothetical protein